MPGGQPFAHRRRAQTNQPFTTMPNVSRNETTAPHNPTQRDSTANRSRMQRTAPFHAHKSCPSRDNPMSSLAHPMTPSRQPRRTDSGIMSEPRPPGTVDPEGVVTRRRSERRRPARPRTTQQSRRKWPGWLCLTLTVPGQSDRTTLSHHDSPRATGPEGPVGLRHPHANRSERPRRTTTAPGGTVRGALSHSDSPSATGPDAPVGLRQPQVDRPGHPCRTATPPGRSIRTLLSHSDSPSSLDPGVPVALRQPQFARSGSDCRTTTASRAPLGAPLSHATAPRCPYGKLPTPVTAPRAPSGGQLPPSTAPPAPPWP
jgi:hypothetical protein